MGYCIDGKAVRALGESNCKRDMPKYDVKREGLSQTYEKMASPVRMEYPGA